MQQRRARWSSGRADGGGWTVLHVQPHCWLFVGKLHGVGSSLPRSGTGAVRRPGRREPVASQAGGPAMENSGGNKASGGASLGTRLVVLGLAAGALGYAFVYFFDRSRGEERRRRVLEAAQAAVQEVVLLSQRLAAGAAPEPAPGPERALASEPLVERPRDYDAPVPAREMTDSLHEKVTFFRLGDEEADEAPALAPVAVIAEELPGSRRGTRPRDTSRSTTRRRWRRRSSPTTPIRRARPNPSPSSSRRHPGSRARAGRCSRPPPSSPSSPPPRRWAPGRSGAAATRSKPRRPRRPVRHSS